MNWYKLSQLVNQTDQSESNIDVPNVNIRPYELLIYEAAEQLQRESPGILNNVTDINVDMGYGQFGSVISHSPNSVNINMGRIKEQARAHLGTDVDPTSPQAKEALLFAIKQTLVHEVGHIADEEIDESGNVLFPGGEHAAEKFVNDYFGL